MLSSQKTGVLVVDDSQVVRALICDHLASAPDVEVVGVAGDGEEALQRLEHLQPDVVTLDIQMPKLDGIETLDKILRRQPTPVIMVSALTQRTADVTLEALDRGAMDYVAKPDGLSAGKGEWLNELLHKIRATAGIDVNRILGIRKTRQEKRRNAFLGSAGTSPVDTFNANRCIAIGISTGGPPALAGLFETIRPPLPAMIVVQHMPGQFTRAFAERLDACSALSIKEAETGDLVLPNHVLIAPGGKHLTLKKYGPNVKVIVCDGEPVSGHKPSIDVMMKSAAEIYGERCLGVIMTGMGSDGAEGCGAIRVRGGRVFGQDERTSDVYGMNKVALVRGHVDRQFALEDLPRLLMEEPFTTYTPISN